MPTKEKPFEFSALKHGRSVTARITIKALARVSKMKYAEVIQQGPESVYDLNAEKINRLAIMMYREGHVPSEGLLIRGRDVKKLT